MILYQLAKRLEQRNRLQHTINRSEGDVSALMTEKEQMDTQLKTQASTWKEEGQDEFVLAALSPDTEAMQSQSFLL
ncbi:hypothetical protein ACFQI7_24190 [Paenibacillus allorhizosphaerae]|uniref:Uncharacterized protein n=1 Tax=Paenibacillus allorhizosphaerae TaxID=2849866 RepID=A0ABM8VKC2_9BACL|nr:hypothetical protein [Paenibacillus allorhizosphaerae]CAG7646806.1 hypothetical protein PAECIP111802_03836 [Paenibacillus allorhizosphaerae]